MNFLPSISLLLGYGDSAKAWGIVLGAAAFGVGIVLMFRHQQSWLVASASKSDERIRLFEQRKYRRRMTANSMIAAIGVMLMALSYATEPKVFAILVSLVLVTLLGVLGLAFIDLFSVGLQQLTKKDDSARKKLVAEYLQRRQQQAENRVDKNE